METKHVVLVVDDQRELFDILSKFLNSKDFDLHYRRAEETIEFIQSAKHIDLIIMDVMMPMINGYDLTKQIRELNLSYYIPIVMLTAKNEVSDVVRGLETGADDYIKKPFEFSELLARINSSLRRSAKETLPSSGATEPLELGSSGKTEELEKKVYYLNNLIEMSYELHSVLELDKLVNIALFALISHLGSKSAALLMSTSPIDSLIVPLDSKGILEDKASRLSVDRFDELFKYFKDKDKPMLVSDLKRMLPETESLTNIEDAGIVLIAPVHHGNHLDGFILLGERIKSKEYQAEEIDVLKMFNSMLAVAITNASMYERIKELSYTDGMTQLHNYRYFEKRLSEELARAKRNSQGLALLILDVDHFKNYNDTLGHQAGDEALRILSNVLKETARNVDIVCRYGGEEFAAILPNMNMEGAEIFAERVREAIEIEKFPKEEVQPKGCITVSIGVSFFPNHSEEISDLIYKADLALYKAKKDGRNRVIFFNESVASDSL
jgi:two-component system cell cycle response regulator